MEWEEVGFFAQGGAQDLAVGHFGQGSGFPAFFRGRWVWFIVFFGGGEWWRGCG